MDSWTSHFSMGYNQLPSVVLMFKLPPVWPVGPPSNWFPGPCVLILL